MLHWEAESCKEPASGVIPLRIQVSNVSLVYRYRQG